MKTSSFYRITRLTIHGTLLVALNGWIFATASIAQDQPGHNLIFGNEGRVGTGGPTAALAKELLQQRIKEQSGGQMTLFGFRQIASRPLDLELDGKIAVAVDFEAGVEFAAPCRWASRHRGSPLTFFVLKPDSNLRNADPQNVVEVKEKGERYVMQGYALFTPKTNGWALAGFGQSRWGRPTKESVVPDEASAECVNQLKQIGLAFRMWALDHDDKFPFNAGLQAGGTMELCARGSDGFDTNAPVHFQILSNELNTPNLLVCPKDSSRQPARDFRMLQAVNVTYLIRSGTNINDTNFEEVLVRCPIHGHVCLCDGSVRKGGSKKTE